jgi:glycosyltransferase involved in cell wall biosynthesis
MESPLVTIGMGVRNCERTLGSAIASIINQTFWNWELLVIDDGSSDSTMCVASSFNDPRIIAVSDGNIILDREYYGLAARLNQAVTRARGKYFARMDGDDIACPERFRRQVDFLEANSDVDLLATAMIVFKDDGTVLGCRPVPTSHEEICARPWAGFPMGHPTWMGKLKWFRKNPYLEGCVRMEDKELLFRTCKTSKFACINEPLLAYRENSLSVTKVMSARWGCAKVLVSEGNLKEVVLGLGGQAVASLRDIAAISSGLNYKVLKHRAVPVTPNLMKGWAQLWSSSI